MVLQVYPCGVVLMTKILLADAKGLMKPWMLSDPFPWTCPYLLAARFGEDRPDSKDGDDGCLQMPRLLARQTTGEEYVSGW